MRVDTLTVGRKFNLGNFESIDISITISLEEGEIKDLEGLSERVSKHFKLELENMKDTFSRKS